MKLNHFIAIGLFVLGTVACSSDQPPTPAPAEVITVTQTTYFNSIWFALNSAVIEQKFDPIIELNASYLRTDPSVQVQIQGNASTIGSEAHNQKLGLARAHAVANRLIALGVSPNQIQVISFGATRPVFTDNKSAQEKRNRRVDIIYINDAPRSYFIDKVPLITTNDEPIALDSDSVLQKTSMTTLKPAASSPVTH